MLCFKIHLFAADLGLVGVDLLNEDALNGSQVNTSLKPIGRAASSHHRDGLVAK